MVVNEKGLCRAMNEAAASHGGYKLFMNGYNLKVLSGSWAVSVPLETIPRKVLALIVEHVGSIPEGECLEIVKKKDKFIVSDYITDVYADEFRAITGTIEDAQAKNTGITAWGQTIYAGQNRELVLVEPELFDLVNRSAAVPLISENGALAWHTDEGSVWLRTKGVDSSFNERDLAVWDALKSVDWWWESKPASVPSAESGQMELEDDDE